MECDPIVVGYGGGRGHGGTAVRADRRSGSVPLQCHYRIWLWVRWNLCFHANSDLSSDFREVEM